MTRGTSRQQLQVTDASDDDKSKPRGRGKGQSKGGKKERSQNSDELEKAILARRDAAGHAPCLRFFGDGKCRRGDECRFSHTVELSS